MAHIEGVGARTKALENQRDLLVDDLKKLEARHKKGEIDEEVCTRERHDIERAIVEIMDRLVQMRFFSGQP